MTLFWLIVVAVFSLLFAGLFHLIAGRRSQDRGLQAWTAFLLGPFALPLLLHGRPDEREAAPHRCD